MRIDRKVLQASRATRKDAQLVIDTFDNSASRRLLQNHCRAHGLACLHAGLFADYGEVIWDEAVGNVWWMSLAATLAVGGVWLWWLAAQLGKHPIVPVGDPYLEEAMAHEHAH